MSDITSTSPRSLWRVSFPLMISFMSTFAMMFFDRMFLSYYSKEALNAAAISGTLSWSFIVCWLTLATLAEVFVAQYNGAKRHRELARPVWQMIWLAVGSIAFFAVLAFVCTDIFYPGKDQTLHRTYFKWLAFSGPFAVMNAGISAFYVGRGKGNVIKWLSILSNVVNVILDPILIFGISGFIPSMGIKGAAIATGIGYIVQTVVIFSLFVSKKNRQKYHTLDAKFRPKLFKSCLKVGSPPALFAGLEVLAWALFYSMMQSVSKEHIFVASVCQSIEILFLFFCFGLEKGVAAIAGNLIGAKMQDKLKKLVKSGYILILFFALILSLFNIVYPDPLIKLFLNQDSATQALSLADLTRYYTLIRISLVFITICLVLEAIRWLYSGILTAAGDTLFLMVTGTAGVWLLLLVPCYFIIVIGRQSVVFAFAIWVFYATMGALLNLLRFKSGAWKSKVVIDEETSNDTPITLSESSE